MLGGAGAQTRDLRFAVSFYSQYDGLIELYNEKFGRPGAAIFAALQINGLICEVPFEIFRD